ncbi:MAG: hypothetical protein M3463_05780 [Verrucomicrobiota bacterium]|nr:hypothetical protein [Verrucomicrobiota bacterium]
MLKLPLALWLALFYTLAHATPREEWFRNLSLESAVARSELILAAQVIEVTEIKLMRGGKGESAMFQYKLKPERVLKGVFARDELSLGSADLGLYRAEEMKQIKQGAFMLIFLGRSDVGYRNTNPVSGGALGQSMPPLRDASDPLLDAVRTLLAVNAERDRVKRVALLSDGLNKASGPGAIALLDSLRRRSLLAAQNMEVAGAITRHLTDASPAVRESTAHTLRAILEADYLEQAPLRQMAVAKCVEALELNDPHILSRAAIMRALGAAGAPAARDGKAIMQLTPETRGNVLVNTIERAAQFRALGDLKATDYLGATMEWWLLQLPLDDAGEYSRAAEYAFARATPRRAERTAILLRVRLGQKISRGLDARIEIDSLRHLPPDHTIPLLIEISRLALTRDEESALAETCREIVEQKRDARLVEPLSRLLAPDEPSRDSAIGALLTIDSGEAAKALQPHLREEQNLSRKLRIAEMLGRHGIRDGYAFAIEHVSEHSLLEQAVAALAAIKEPQAVVRLKEILETSNDLAWNTAAVRGLGAMGAQEMTPKFLTLIEDLRNPLAPAALIALADLGERQALDKASEGLGSRNDDLVTAGARAAGKLLARPGVNDPDVRTKLVALLVDADAEPGSRAAALSALLAAKDERLDAALAKVVREAKLESSGLLDRVEILMRERKVKLE